MAVNTPVFTDTVDQNFFIEALGGAKNPVSYLDRFPETVYTKALDSVLVTFAYALLGPAGAGFLREQYLQARLQVEQADVRGASLDALYSSPFTFARLAEETYDIDASAQLLSSADRATILAQDQAFRNRAIDYLKGIRAGGTPLGLQLVAKSASGMPVDIIENYKALYDRYSDVPLGITQQGRTSDLNEVIVVPRSTVAANSQQSIVLTGEPISGSFSIIVPRGRPYQTIQVTATNGSSLLTVPDSAMLSLGTYLTIAGIANYVPNPSFEYDTSGSAPAAWSSSAFSLNVGATLTATSAQAKVGSQAMQVVTTSTNNAEGACCACPGIGTFQSGVTYSGSVWVKGNVGGEKIDVILGSTADDDSFIATNLTLTTSWQQVTGTWTPTANRSGSTHGIAVRTSSAVAAQAVTFFVDAAMVAQGSSITTYFDGDSTGYAWSGTPGDSATVGPTDWTQVGTIDSPTQITMFYSPAYGGADVGQPYAWTGTTGTYTAYVGNTQTYPLPYNCTAAAMQTALWALPVIGAGNVMVTGGPLPDQPIVISLINELADITLPPLIIYTSSDPVTGIVNSTGVVNQMADVTGSYTSISSTVTTALMGAGGDKQTKDMSPAEEQAMLLALDQIRPVNSFITTQSGRSTTTRLPSSTVFAPSTYTEVLRYETGNSGVIWPPTDNVHWIQSGIENEAPRPVDSVQQHYQGFHNVAGITSYTEQALNDANYASGTATTPIWQTYWNTHVGPFTSAQSTLYPLLAQFQDPAQQFLPTLALAPSPEPLVINTSVDGMGIINDLYPVDYLSLSGVPQLSKTQTFWSSVERAPSSAQTDSSDYLEIDLGTPQAVNYLYFEATNKPYQISVDYDTLDQSPARNFVPVQLMPPSVATSITTLAYDASRTNPWTTVELFFTNSINSLIFTRFIRIRFQRSPGNSPFFSSIGGYTPYSIEVRNLRIGRNLSPLQLDRYVSIMSSPNGLLPMITLLPGETVFPN